MIGWHICNDMVAPLSLNLVGSKCNLNFCWLHINDRFGSKLHLVANVVAHLLSTTIASPVREMMSASTNLNTDH